MSPCSDAGNDAVFHLRAMPAEPSSMKGDTMKSITKFLFALAIVPLSLTGAAGTSGTARAGSGAAFLGGMVAGHVVGGFVRRDRAKTAAAVNQSYSQPTTVVVKETAPAPSASKSVEQRLSELDDLAKKGIITKDEYKARRQAILDSL
jgi:hypothetical protein